MANKDKNKGKTKTYVTFDATTSAIRDSNNVTSVTYNKTGDYTIKFDKPIKKPNKFIVFFKKHWSFMIALILLTLIAPPSNIYDFLAILFFAFSFWVCIRLVCWLFKKVLQIDSYMNKTLKNIDRKLEG